MSTPYDKVMIFALIILCLSVFWIWMLIDMLVSKRIPASSKVLWFLGFWLFWIFTVFVYYFVEYRPAHKKSQKDNFLPR